VAPEWRHPLIGQTAQALLDALPAQSIDLIVRSHLREEGVAPN
jgi:hypothetical protein